MLEPRLDGGPPRLGARRPSGHRGGQGVRPVPRRGRTGRFRRGRTAGPQHAGQRQVVPGQQRGPPERNQVHHGDVRRQREPVGAGHGISRCFSARIIDSKKAPRLRTRISTSPGRMIRPGLVTRCAPAMDLGRDAPRQPHRRRRLVRHVERPRPSVLLGGFAGRLQRPDLNTPGRLGPGAGMNGAGFLHVRRQSMEVQRITENLVDGVEDVL